MELWVPDAETQRSQKLRMLPIHRKLLRSKAIASRPARAALEKRTCRHVKRMSDNDPATSKHKTFAGCMTPSSKRALAAAIEPAVSTQEPAMSGQNDRQDNC